MLWINLTRAERQTLEHLDDIHSGAPQLIELTPGEPVRINGTARSDLPVPDARSIKRMHGCLERSEDHFEIFEFEEDCLRIKLKPFEKRGKAA